MNPAGRPRTTSLTVPPRLLVLVEQRGALDGQLLLLLAQAAVLLAQASRDVGQAVDPVDESLQLVE